MLVIFYVAAKAFLISSAFLAAGGAYAKKILSRWR